MMELNKLLNPVVEDSIMTNAPQLLPLRATGKNAGLLLALHDHNPGMHYQDSEPNSSLTSNRSSSSATPPTSSRNAVTRSTRPKSCSKDKKNSAGVTKQNSKGKKPHITAPANSPIRFDHSEIYSGRTLVVSSDKLVIAEQHSIFNVSTVEHAPGNIRDNAHDVPYASEKPGGKLLKALGYKMFKAFEYQFTYKGKTWLMAWDYRNGYTRVASLFKAVDLKKTDPRKAMEAVDKAEWEKIRVHANGGKTDRQGFWIPYDIAKMLAANFCWEIRYALTPIFGDEFPSTCLRPDHPDFGKYVVDKHVVDSVKRWLAGEKARVAGRPATSTRPARGSRAPATTADSAEEAIAVVTVSHTGLSNEEVSRRLSAAGRRSGRRVWYESGAPVVRSPSPGEPQDVEGAVRRKKEVSVYYDNRGKIFYPATWGAVSSEELETILVRIAEEDEAVEALGQLQRGDAELAGQQK